MPEPRVSLPASREPGAPVGERAATGDALRDALAARQRRRRLQLGALGAVIAALLAVSSGGFFWFAVLVLGGMGLTSLALAASGSEGAAVSRVVEKERLEQGERVLVEVTLENRSALPIPWLYWEDRVDGGLTPEGPSCAALSVRGNGRVSFSYWLPARRRGLYRVGPAVIEATGPFGVVRRVRLGREATFLTVLPRPVALGRARTPAERPVREIPRRRSLFEDPSRFAGVREFRTGDGLRRVHWRATARAGRLQSRVYEPAVLGGILLAVEMGGDAWPGEPDEDGFHPLVELAITTAASLSDHVLGSGQAVGLFSNGGDAAQRYPLDWSGEVFQRRSEAEAGVSARSVDRLRPVEVAPGRGSWQRDRMRTALARLVPSAGMSLPELLVVELPRLSRSMVLGVITPRLDGALAGALATVRGAGIEVSVVWLRRAGEGGRPVAPPGVSVYPVSSRRDLALLGAVKL
jgi:uncharacterized protein (DUF58 family)